MSIFSALMALAGFAGAGGFTNLERQFNANPNDNPSLAEWTIPAGSAAMMGMLPMGVGAGAAQGVRNAFPRIMGGSQLNPSGMMNRMLTWSPLQKLSNQPFVQNQLRPFAERNVVGRIFPTTPITSPFIPPNASAIGPNINSFRYSLGQEGLSRIMPNVGRFAWNYPLTFSGGLAGGGLGVLGTLLSSMGGSNNQPPQRDAYLSFDSLSPQQQIMMAQLLRQQGQL